MSADSGTDGTEFSTIVPTTMVENVIMRYYASYYFPPFVNGATYSFTLNKGLIDPGTHAKWPIRAIVPEHSLLEPGAAATASSKEALELVNLTLSGSAMGSHSSKAYAFVWLMVIINSVPDEIFPAEGGHHHFFKKLFSDNRWFPKQTQPQIDSVDARALETRLEHDLEVWKSIADLGGMSKAYSIELQKDKLFGLSNKDSRKR